MPDIESFRSFMKSAERHGLAGSVADPVKKSLHLKHRWKVFLLEEPTSDEYLVLIQFRSRAGQWDTALFPMEMTCEPGRLLKLLQGKNARLGGSKDEKLEFLRRVIAAIPKRAIKLTSRPGFVNNATGFVMPSRMYGSAEGVFLWDPRAAEDALAKAQGTLEGYQPVLKAALHSPFLTAAILIPLAAPLPSYVKARSHKHLVAEGAIFHWWGDTSSGKTLLSQTTASVFGAPHLSQSFDITARAISEVAARSNDLVVIVDDSEVTDTDAECHKMMALLGRVLPRGYSKAISRVPGKTYPPLTWSCLGVTSGPISSAELARRLGRPRFGQAVRFFDIPVPQSGKGGIFSSKLKGTKEDHVDPSALLDTLTHAISSKFGVLFPAWIDLLLSEELADRTEKLVSRFVRKVGAHAGAEERAARKFGLLYAAGVLGVSLGLLPWPKSWPFEAVAYLYQRSRDASDPDSALIDKAIEKLCKKLNDPSCFPPKRSIGPTRFSQDAIGLRNREGRILLCKSRLTALGLHDKRLQQALINRLATRVAAVPGTPHQSAQLRVRGAGGIRKVRFWDIGRAAELLSER